VVSDLHRSHSHAQDIERPDVRVVFLTDVEGVYDRPPRSPSADSQPQDQEAKLIQKISVDDTGQVLDTFIRATFSFLCM
jgi:isopentenyl phosphate kinase